MSFKVTISDLKKVSQAYESSSRPIHREQTKLGVSVFPLTQKNNSVELLDSNLTTINHFITADNTRSKKAKDNPPE